MLSPQPKLNPYDIRVDIWRPVLAAGEVRLTHLPTGLVARCSIAVSLRESHRRAQAILEQLVETHEAMTADQRAAGCWVCMCGVVHLRWDFCGVCRGVDPAPEVVG